ncbi:isochorismatase hydrolase [Teratosphaeria nubilosa]|uniref:Isochorismatase hydrolase n=1 Tax=Teratosphaeria nubilosa TaxID=161662 RepID=A0A6G1LIB8_9PEZI|nr:isochorismatase hydrolase [Teratosphaeria nubilosa]
MHMTVLLALATVAAGQIYDTYNSITALAGTANGSDDSILGNCYNYWKLTNNKTTWDLTRSDHMQNYFLHPKLSPKAVNGRQAVQPILNMIDAFRSNGMMILWVHWGIDNFDMVTLPPAFLDTFSTNHEVNTTFCTEVGMLTEDNGTVIDMGKLLCRGSWNAQPWGPLNDALNEGLAAGTDLYFNKNRLSGLWGAQTPLGLYLQESGTTTLFIGGVNSHQCVWSTLIDAYFKGFDVVYVEDCTGTTSPWFAEEMARYNADLDGFLANSSYVIDALEKQK